MRSSSFYRALGTATDSLVEDEVSTRRRSCSSPRRSDCDLRLPVDLVSATASADAEHRVAGRHEVPRGWMGSRIGPRTSAEYAREIEGPGRFGNGPMGAFELEPSRRHRAVAEAVARAPGLTVVGGGDLGRGAGGVRARR